MSGVLERILASKRAEIAQMRGAPRAPGPREPATVQNFAAALRRAPGARLGLLTEIKHKSPSGGELSTKLSVGERALVYARGGAAAISVLCDGPFFGGSFDHVAEARRALDLAGLAVPILAKEFVLDEAQIVRARGAGADALLLIVRIVGGERLRALVEATRDAGLEPLVEITDEPELAAALDAGATVLGVNARDLDTLVMDAARAARVLDAIPAGRIAVHLSGLKGPEDIVRIAATRADAALVGEALMREDDPTALLASMARGT